MTRASLSKRLFTWANGLRALGAGGFVLLLLESGVERPTYMIACLALMGLPNAIQFDVKRKDPPE